MWIIVSLSSFERAFFSRRTHVELNKWAAIFRFHSKSAFDVMTTYLRVAGAVGLGRFELPSQGPKPRRIDQATPQPRLREQPGGAINTLSQRRRFGFRASFRTRSMTTPWPLRPPTTFAMRKITACTPNVCAYADRRASSASFVAPYTEIGSHGA